MFEQSFNNIQYLQPSFGSQIPPGIGMSRLGMPGQPFLGMAPPGMGFMPSFQLPPGLAPVPFMQQPVF